MPEAAFTDNATAAGADPNAGSAGDTTTIAADVSAPTAHDEPPRRRVDKTLVIVSLVVGLGLALVTRGVLIGVTGDDRSPLPAAIERVDPVPDAEQVLSQSAVFVDLAPGFIGELSIDGVAIPTIDVSEVSDDRVEPGEQVDVPPGAVYEPGNATLTFVPSDDAPITSLTDGVHRASVRYWRLDQGEQRARTYTWSFNVV